MFFCLRVQCDVYNPEFAARFRCRAIVRGCRETVRSPSDIRGTTLTIVCEPCGRRGQYNVERLMAERGDAKLTELLVTLANCPKARSASVYDRCRVVYEGLAVR